MQSKDDGLEVLVGRGPVHPPAAWHLVYLAQDLVVERTLSEGDLDVLQVRKGRQSLPEVVAARMELGQRLAPEFDLFELDKGGAEHVGAVFRELQEMPAVGGVPGVIVIQVGEVDDNRFNTAPQPVVQGDIVQAVDVIPVAQGCEAGRQQVLVSHIGQGGVNLAKYLGRREIAVAVDEPQQLDR